MTRLTLPELLGPESDDDDFNQFLEALSENILPRNADGDAEDKAGSIGTSTYPWLTANIKIGYMTAGSIISWYDYNGAVALPHGYMLCNGDQITQAKYNEQHRTDVSDETDYWAQFIGSSPLENLHTPNSNGRFFKGTTSATQSGTSALTRVGNPNNSLNLAHNHGGTLTTSAVGNVEKDTSGLNPNYQSANTSAHTHDFSLSTDLSTVDVTPPSIEVKFLIRIVE
jgi:hypothetical protein